MTTNHPLLFQINTRVRLTELSETLGRRATLDDITDQELDRITEQGFDWVWFLSVWTVGPLARAISRSNPEWREEFKQTLPDLKEDDIGGSGFAIADYNVDPAMGGNEALARLRARLAKPKLKLMLDFVPNHTGPDHAWASSHPEFYVHDAEGRLAQGRDPYFPPWPDTLQLDYSNPATQQAMKQELLRISGQCDGVRCDMAMLVLPDVFERTWGKRMEPFWADAVQHVRRTHPEFCFMAECYWDREWDLQQTGFNYTYDKRLYDRLRQGTPSEVRGHLRAGLDYQNKLARFLENHDEPRAAATFPLAVHKAAAVVTFLTPGLRFFHQGQFEGKQKRISPHFVRGPKEPINAALQEFYTKLLSVLQQPLVHEGNWQMLYATPAWEGNWTNDSFIAFEWRLDERVMVAVVNYSDHQSQCYLHCTPPEAETVRFADCMGAAVYDRDGADIANRGLYLDMQPWQTHIFDVTAITQERMTKQCLKQSEMR